MSIEEQVLEIDIHDIVKFINLYKEDSPKRNMIEEVIKQKYLSVHQAKISYFMPTLLGLENKQHFPVAGIGFQLAHNKNLFLEQYLSCKVEEEISQVEGRKIRRRDIIEIGNIASSIPGCGRLLLYSLFWFMRSTSIHWIVLTATKKMYSLLEAMRISYVVLEEARKEKLHHSQDDWGIYYQTEPKVIYINYRALLQQQEKIIQEQLTNLKFKDNEILVPAESPTVANCQQVLMSI